MPEHNLGDNQPALNPPWINKENKLSFFLPPDPTTEQQLLIADIVSLDHRAHDRLGPETPEWEEVLGILKNAALTGVTMNQPEQGRLIYSRAEEAFYDHIQNRNRVRYLLAMIIGIIAAAAFGSAIILLSSFVEQSFVTPQLLILLFFFAGIGSITSVLTRLSSIDLRQETSNVILIVSGATRPVVAIFFAMVVYIVLDLRIVELQLGTSSEANRNGIYLVAAFLCGFSERFATDHLARVAPSK